MKYLTHYIRSQFRNPHGIVGKLCCLIMNVMNRSMYRQVLKDVSILPCSTLLEIGFGNGYLLSELHKRSLGTIYGIDLSADMLMLASRHNDKALATGAMHLQLADSCSLPFDTAFFDAIISINTIYFWNDIVQGLSEVYRTLHPSGTFYNVVYSKKWLQRLSYTKSVFNFYEIDDYIRYGMEVGFKDVQIKTIIADKSFMVLFIK